MMTFIELYDKGKDSGWYFRIKNGNLVILSYTENEQDWLEITLSVSQATLAVELEDVNTNAEDEPEFDIIADFDETGVLDEVRDYFLAKKYQVNY